MTDEEYVTNLSNKIHSLGSDIVQLNDSLKHIADFPLATTIIFNNLRSMQIKRAELKRFAIGLMYSGGHNKINTPHEVADLDDEL